MNPETSTVCFPFSQYFVPIKLQNLNYCKYSVHRKSFKLCIFTFQIVDENMNEVYESFKFLRVFKTKKFRISSAQYFCPF